MCHEATYTERNSDFKMDDSWHFKNTENRMGNQQGPPAEHRELCSASCASLNEEGIWKRVDSCVCITESIYRAPETHTALLTSCTPVCVTQTVRAASWATPEQKPVVETQMREDCAHPPQELVTSQEEGRSSRRDTGRTRAWSSRLCPPWRFPGAWRLDPGAVQLRESVPVACFIFSV